jgi:predicted RNA-binding protein with PIN domain
MSLQYVIDGYNITCHEAFNKSTKGRVSSLALIRLIKTRRLCGKNKAIIVFDGFPPASEVTPEDSEVSVIFSRSLSADEKIKSIIEKASNPKNIVVVSDDKEIKFIVKAIGAKPLSVEKFINPQSRTRGKKLEPEAELSFSQMEDINKELRKIWLK